MSKRFMTFAEMQEAGLPVTVEHNNSPPAEPTFWERFWFSVWLVVSFPWFLCKQLWCNWTKRIP